MSSNTERLVGIAVWQGAKWYLRRRLPSTRRILATGLFTAAVIGALAAIVKRAG